MKYLLLAILAVIAYQAFRRLPHTIEQEPAFDFHTDPYIADLWRRAA